MLQLDHVVHFTEKQPEEVVGNLKSYQLNAVVGGSHEQWGTHNALLYTKGSYIEFLSMEHEKIVQQSENPLIIQMKVDLPKGPGFGTICMRTDDIRTLKEQLSANGLQTSEIYQAQRKTATGTIRRWKMLFVDEKLGDQLPYPFFIEWEEEDEKRYQALKEDGTIKENNELLSVESCIFRTNDPASTAMKWRQALGLSTGGDVEHEIHLPNCRLIFHKGHGKERLLRVNIAGYDKKMELKFEGGFYSFS